MKSINRDYAYCIFFSTLLLLPLSCIQILYSEYYFTSVTNKQTNRCAAIKYFLQHIIIHRYVSVASATIARVSYMNTNNCTASLIKTPLMLKRYTVNSFQNFILNVISQFVSPYFNGIKSFASIESISALGENT